jgi:hypothetical protein
MNNNKIVITIGGKAENGKNSLATLLKSELESKGNSVCILGFGDETKLIATQAYEWNGIKDEQGRTLLQEVCEKLVKKSPIYCVSSVQRRINVLSDEFDYFIVTDNRFPIEIEHLKNCGLNIVSLYVESETLKSTLTDEQKQHISEISLSKDHCDIFVSNTTISKLKKQAKLLAEAIINNTIPEYIENSTKIDNTSTPEELKIEFNFEDYESPEPQTNTNNESESDN